MTRYKYPQYKAAGQAYISEKDSLKQIATFVYDQEATKAGARRAGYCVGGGTDARTWISRPRISTRVSWPFPSAPLRLNRRRRFRLQRPGAHRYDNRS